MGVPGAAPGDRCDRRLGVRGLVASGGRQPLGGHRSASFSAAVTTYEYPVGIRDFLVGVYRYVLRVEAYAGLLTDTYPPFRLAA